MVFDFCKKAFHKIILVKFITYFKVDGIISYSDLRNQNLRVTLSAFQDKRQERIDFTEVGDMLVYCVGGAGRDVPNRTRIVLFAIAKLSGYSLKFDTTDNVALIRPFLKKDAVPNPEDFAIFKRFAKNLALMFACRNLSNINDADVKYLFKT